MKPSRYLKGQLLSTVLSSRVLYFFKALASSVSNTASATRRPYQAPNCHENHRVHAREVLSVPERGETDQVHQE